MGEEDGELERRTEFEKHAAPPRSPIGRALRYLKGEQNIGDGPIEVKSRVTDFNLMTVQGPDGRPAAIPAASLIDFTAQAFREIGAGSDLWEFRVMSQTEPDGPAAAKHIYIDGSDLLLVRAPCKVL